MYVILHTHTHTSFYGVFILKIGATHQKSVRLSGFCSALRKPAEVILARPDCDWLDPRVTASHWPNAEIAPLYASAPRVPSEGQKAEAEAEAGRGHARDVQDNGTDHTVQTLSRWQLYCPLLNSIDVIWRAEILFLRTPALARRRSHTRGEDETGRSEAISPHAFQKYCTYRLKYRTMDIESRMVCMQCLCILRTYGMYLVYVQSKCLRTTVELSDRQTRLNELLTTKSVLPYSTIQYNTSTVIPAGGLGGTPRDVRQSLSLSLFCNQPVLLLLLLFPFLFFSSSLFTPSSSSSLLHLLCCPRARPQYPPASLPPIRVHPCFPPAAFRFDSRSLLVIRPLPSTDRP